MSVIVDGKSLTIDKIDEVARGYEKVSLSKLIISKSKLPS